jgi:predicted nucleic acid-binding protein
MSYLVDRSVLMRLANGADPSHSIAAGAMLELHRRKESLHLAPQNLVEFRNAATRPTAVNGLGLSSSEAEAKANGFEARLLLLPETPAIHQTWKSIVSTLGILGKQVHDARLVAVCHVNAVSIF